ncbi:hypothetical protein [Lentilactobacillus kisonensis]|nr:hypothetical protein [Lentilactobacillus kisonensis]KRL22665.1 S-layer domain protein [Lentilactobacillus kisonensis DSM 19906 = JCM 15041]
MKFSVKKSLFVSLAALGLFTAAASSNASAKAKKSYPHLTANKVLSTNPYNRNVNLTGKNALYNKVGTLPGTRVVATKTTAKQIASSTNSKDNLRAYRVATTSKGSVYYKVVSFDGNYRGWVYGGKSTQAFAGGLKPYTTFTEGTLTDNQKNTLYRIANPGIANDGKSATYTEPHFTQYTLNRDDRQIDNTTTYGDARFHIDQIGTRTREGDTWVHIVATDPAYTVADGWIMLAGLTPASPVTK